MSSGRRESAVIFCLSPFSGLYLPSLKFYRPDRVYVFMDSGDGVVSTVERDIYESVKSQISCDDLEEIEVDTHDYEDILSKVVDIKKNLQDKFGEDLDLFINISSGTNEFSAAAMFAAMLPNPSIAFRVPTDTKDLDKNTLLNIAKTLESEISYGTPCKVTGIENDEPDEEIVGFLQIMAEMLRNSRNPRHESIISTLKKRGFWSHDPKRKSNYGRTPLEQKEEMYLKRHYFAPALEMGLLERPYPNVYRISQKGGSYLSVFAPTPEPMMLCRESSVEPCILHDYSESDCEEEVVCWHRGSVGSSSIKAISAEEISDSIEEEGHTYRFKKRGKTYSFRIDVD